MASREDKFGVIRALKDLVLASGNFQPDDSVHHENHRKVPILYRGNGPRVHVVVPNFFETGDEFINISKRLQSQGDHILPIFYGDGITALVHLEGARRLKTLRLYIPEQRDNIIKLRKQERFVLDAQRSEPQTLHYFMPEEREVFSREMSLVRLDNSDLRPNDRGYGRAQNGLALTYRLLGVPEPVEPSARIVFHQNRFATLKPAQPSLSPADVQRQLVEEACHAYPDLADSPQRAYAALMGKPL
jgi:hypothetical protein